MDHAPFLVTQRSIKSPYLLSWMAGFCGQQGS